MAKVRDKYTTEQILEALEGNTVARAAKLLGVSAPLLTYWMNTEEELCKTDKEVELALARKARNASNRASAEAKTANLAIDELNSLTSIKDFLKDTTKGISKLKYKKTTPVRKNKKRNMTMEVLFSDIHVGKVTPSFDIDECENRLMYIADTVLDQIDIHHRTFNVERLIIALLGDIIENAIMHGVESAKGCEMPNAMQVQNAIALIFPILVYLSSTKLPIDVYCVPGNHDRESSEKTYLKTGQANLTWIIYNQLEALCNASKLNNVKFHITEDLWLLAPVYNALICYEHGDMLRKPTRDNIEKRLHKIAAIERQHIEFYRCGHFHEYNHFGRGNLITNLSLVGADGYSEALGFSTQAGQVINTYIESPHRQDNPFYTSFPVHLG